MQKIFYSFWVSALLLVSASQTVLSAQSIRQDEWPEMRKTDFGVYNLLDENAPKVSTPVPEGYTVVGISHYGRHGSRYYTNSRASYTEVYELLEQAEKDGMLTERGTQLLRAYRTIYPLMNGREKELTQLGRAQHRGIARRMHSAYPSLFTPASILTAWSTPVPRCIESMGAFCEELARVAPELYVEQESSVHFLGQVSPAQEYGYYHSKLEKAEKKAVWARRFAYADRVMDVRSTAGVLFKNPSYIHNGHLFRNVLRAIWLIYANIPSLEFCSTPQADDFRYAVDGKAIGGRKAMAPLFDDDIWHSIASAEQMNYLAECGVGESLVNTLNPFLLDNIVRLAEEDLLGGRLFLRLRFGHDTMIQCLLKDMNVRGWRLWEACDSLSSEQALAKTQAEWSLSRIPMASHLEFVFYRKDAGVNTAAPKSAPAVLFKLLLNDSELELPIPAVYGRTYDWDVFKAYMQPRIDQGKERAKTRLRHPYPISFVPSAQ